MIEYPGNWHNVGQEIKPFIVNEKLAEILKQIGCNSLSFSGGIDSSLLLWHLSHLYNHVYIYTIASNELHPDAVFSKQIADLFPNVIHRIYIPDEKSIQCERCAGEEFKGDAGVRLFYQWVSKYTDHIIAGDGIDEFMCGYYDHQNKPNEDTYYEYLRRLQKEQLIPLNKNSGQVKVYLPYIDIELITLLSQIPISDKVDNNNRKKFMFQLIEGKLPIDLFLRRKRGFVSALDYITELSYA